jgi:MFS family permease
MTGINVINYYQTILYEGLGFVGNKGTLVAGIYNCVGPVANLIFITLLLDRVGRRKPLLFGTIGITVALVCSAVLTSQNPNGERQSYSIGGVFFIFCVSIVFSFSFGPISWYVLSSSIKVMERLS